MGLLFESTECTRCGGTGKWSYCPGVTGKYGAQTCFKCAGEGDSLTKRGAVAQKFLVGLCTKRASELIVGDTVRYTDVYGSQLAERWLTVASLSVELFGQTGIYSADRKYIFRQPYVEITTAKGTRATFNIDEKVRTRSTPEQRETALAFQATLTKTGTVRKAK